MYVAEGLPPGSYYLSAPLELPRYGDRAWEDPAFLETLVRDAQVVTVSEGQRTTANLRQARPSRNLRR